MHFFVFYLEAFSGFSLYLFLRCASQKDAASIRASENSVDISARFARAFKIYKTEKFDYKTAKI